MAPRLPRVFLAPRVKFAAASAAGARNSGGIFFGAERLAGSDSNRQPQTLKATRGLGASPCSLATPCCLAPPPCGLVPPCWKNKGKLGLIDDIRWSEGANPPLLGVLLRSLKSRVNKTPGQIDVGLNSLQRQAIGSRPDHRISSICPNSGVDFQQAGSRRASDGACGRQKAENNEERSTRRAGKPG